MSSAGRYIPHYTVSDYEQWEGDWELWDGHPIAKSPAPNVQHQRVAKNLFLAIQQSLESNEDCRCELLYEIDWRVKDDTVVRPDLVLSCEPIVGHWLDHAPALIVEVLSPSTEEHDRGYKRGLYAKQGVAYYLIADPKTEQVEALRLVGGAYREIDPGDLQLHEGCALSLDTAAIWR